jgi:uncharacterized repeat protein (TIGR01451 family)
MGSLPIADADHRQGAHAVSASALSFPLFFEPNVGQTDRRVKFMARGAGYGLFLTADEAVLSLQYRAAKGAPLKSDVVRMHLEGASSAARVQGAEPLPGKSSYFIGNKPSQWHSSVPQFGRVEYQHVYPGVDLVYYGKQRELEYDFRVAPGADPNQIAFSFKGASARIDSGELVLTTAGGDIRFHAPHIYQTSTGKHVDAMNVDGGFRQLADNKIGFAIGPYDHSRELVIDPVLSYSTYLGLGGESLSAVAVDSSNNIYLACSTTAAGFPVTTGAVQGTLNGKQNILIAVLSPASGSGSAQLLFASYLGSSGSNSVDSLGGIAVDPGSSLAFPNINIYVAGTTNSPTFPTTSNAFQGSNTVFAGDGSQTHGFLSTINTSGLASGGSGATLTYSTFLAGNTNSLSTTENDIVTGIAVDNFFDAYLTGTTSSTDYLTGFPSTSNAYQICAGQVAQAGGNPCPITSVPTQFFASEVNTAGSGPQSMIYSTYFGGGYPVNATAIGGGVAIDNLINNPPHSSINMYFTGTTNMPGVLGPNGEAAFPLVNAWQTCLNQSGATSSCNAPGTNTDAFVVKINPNLTKAAPTYSTYLGGAGNDTGNGVASDIVGNAYVTGGTYSTDWNCTNSCVFAPSPNGLPSGGEDAYIAKVTDQEGAIFPLVFFAYIGGSGTDVGNAIVVDSVQSAHVAGTTFSDDLNLQDASQQTYGGNGDAFVALISSTVFTTPTGNYVTYLGGSGADAGTGIALDVNGSSYVAGTTQSSDFPQANPYQGYVPTQDAFVTELSSKSTLTVSQASGSPSPSPLPAGQAGTFTFNITNNGPDPAYNVSFTAYVPQSGLQNTPSAEVLSSGSGSCTAPSGGIILCNVGTLAVNAVGQVAVFVTPAIPQTGNSVGVSGQAAANGGALGAKVSQSVNITDFTITPQVLTSNIIAGEQAVIQVTLTPNQTLGYNSTLTMTQSASPSMVTSPSPTFTINPIVLSGTSAQQTVLNIQTVPRPVNSGSVLRHNKMFYATWLPIGGLSLLGLGIGKNRKYRRWLLAGSLLLLASLILLQPACGSGSSPATSGGGTQPGTYTITISASPSAGIVHTATAELFVQ